MMSKCVKWILLFVGSIPNGSLVKTIVLLVAGNLRNQEKIILFRMKTMF